MLSAWLSRRGRRGIGCGLEHSRRQKRRYCPPLRFRPGVEGLESRLAPAALLGGTTTPDAATSQQLQQEYGRLPLSFEANQGQTDAQVQYLSRGQGYALFLTEGGATLSLQKPAASGTGVALKLDLVGANPEAPAAGVDRLTGTSNYFLGNDPSQWHTGVANYGQVAYQGVYPGVNLVYYGNQQQLEYDFVVQPGADPAVIRFRVQGAESLGLDGQGNLVLHTMSGDVVEHAPVLYQQTGGGRQTVAGQFVLLGADEVGFQVGAYDSSLPLTIDPTLSYSTYLGGSGDDYGNGIAVDGSGNAYLTGNTQSTNFPTTAGALQTGLGGNENAFVAKLNAAGTALVYSTYLGGNVFDTGQGIAVDGSGNAYVTGYTDSTNFPTTAGAFRTSHASDGGNADAFVTKLNPTGSALVYSTYLGGASGVLGGSGYDQANGIAVDGSGNAYVTGFTDSTDFPTTAGAFQSSFGSGLNRVFVTKLNTTGTALVYSTYLGGSFQEAGLGIAVDGSDNAYVAGYTQSTDFSTTAGAFQTSSGGNADAFVAKLNATGTALLYSTLLGGTKDDEANGIAVDSAGNAYVTGDTLSTNFPTTAGAFQTSHATDGGTYDAFVTKLNPTGSALIYSTYLGGNDFDFSQAIAVDGSGNAYVTGNTNSSNFPTTAGAFQTTFGGGSLFSDAGDAFVTKLNATGSALLSSTYLGGSGIDKGLGIALDGSGNAYVTGVTSSTDFPTTAGAFKTSHANLFDHDAFVAKFSLGQAGQAPAFTSTNNTTFTYGSFGTFTITASGNPAPTLSENNTDTLPGGVSFNASTGVLSGTPTSSGTFILHFTAHNSVSPDANQTFTLTVNKAHLTVTATNQSKTYGSANPALGFTLSGFLNGDTSSVVSGNPDLSTTATTGSTVGAYPITVQDAGTLSATNYDFPAGNFVGGTLTVNKAHLTVTADNKSKTFDGNPYSPFTATLTGFVNGDSSSVVSGSPGFTGNAVGATAVGTYTITPTLGTLSASNYDFPTFTNGTLTIQPASGQAPAFTSANNTTFTYGSFGTFTVTASGNPTPTLSESNTDTLPGGVSFNASTGVLSGTPTSSGTFTLHFTAHNSVSPDANQTFTLTVNKAHLTVTATNQSKTYGSTNPTLGFTLSGFVNGDTSSVVSGSPDLSTTATTGSAVGTYPITVQDAGTLSATSYDFPAGNFVGGTLTVNKAHLTVTADNKSKTFDGNPYSPFTATLSGFVNGDSSSVVGGSPGFTGNAVGATAVGTYTITPTLGTLSASNYDFPTFTNGTLTIQSASTTTVTFVKTDTTTQGTWQSTYGADGYDLSQGAVSLPAYAQVTPTGQNGYTWASSTTDVRALQKPGASDRLAACWYATSSFTLDVNVTGTHQVGLYLLDWDNLYGGRSERIDVLDTNTNAVLDTRSVTSFSGGEYLVWTISGHVLFRLTNAGPSYSNAVASGLFFGGASVGPQADLAITNTDGGSSVNPGGPLSYTITVSNNGPSAVTGATVADTMPATLSSDSYTAAGSGGASGFSSGTGNINQTVNLPVGASVTYTINATVSNTASGTLSNTATVTAPAGVTDPNLANNTTTATNPISGGGGGSASVTYVRTDTTTQGTWQTAYGGDGYDLSQGAVSLPTYAQVTPTGQNGYTWASSTTDVRALQKPGASDRLAACWYATSSFTLDVNVTGTHQVGLYLLDWDNFYGGRSERVDVLDASNPSSVLDTRSVTSFSGGEYQVWTISGHVLFRITNAGPSYSNAVASGLFFGGASTSGPQADLVISNTDGGSPVSPGGPLTYTITVSNNGPSAVTGATVADTMPAALSGDSYTAAGSGGASGFANGSGNINQAVNLPVGASVTYTVNATVSNSASGTLSNTATVTAPAGVTDPNLANNTTTATNPISGGGGGSASVTFVKTDTTTQGSWQGGYGTSGYALAPATTSLPSYAQLAFSGQTGYTWASSTTDARALQQPGSSNRQAACWYTPTSFTVDVNLTGGAHPVTLYLLDWDNLNGGRSERVDVLDAGNPNTVLDTHTVTGFSNGEYLVWTISGHVLLRITNLKGGNFNAVASGLFFGQPGAPQLAAPGQGPRGETLPPLTERELGPVLTAAEERWIATGLPAAEVQALRGVRAVVTDLPTGYLGRAVLGGTVLYLDPTADGYGWYLDPTPSDDSAFPLVATNGLLAPAGSPAAGHMDLLTVVMHELGHVLNLDSVYGGDPADLMDAYLGTGERRLPSSTDALGRSATAVTAGRGGLSDSSPGTVLAAALETAETSSAETAVPAPGKAGVGFREWTIPDWWFLSAGLGRAKQQSWDTDGVIFAS